MSDEYLEKLYEMSGAEYKIFDKYKVGREVGISNSQTDDIVDDHHNMGLVKKLEQPKYFWLSKVNKKLKDQSQLKTLTLPSHIEFLFGNNLIEKTCCNPRTSDLV